MKNQQVIELLSSQGFVQTETTFSISSESVLQNHEKMRYLAEGLQHEIARRAGDEIENKENGSRCGNLADLDMPKNILHEA